MNKLKYFLFMFIIFLAPNVFAIDVSNKVEAIPDFGGGTYYGQTPTSPTVIVYNNIGTRYQGKLSVISFYLSSDDWNWSYSKTYTIELYMETNDWDNNFMYPQVYRANTNGDTLGSNLAKSSVTFVSNKKIKFTFKTPDDVMNTYLKFRIYSTNYNTTGITRITNYNFNKVVITENQTSGGSGGSSGGTSPTPTPTPTNSTDAIIDSAIQNTEDIINNNNQNTQDIIDNANNNFSQATETITGTLDELLGNKCTNLIQTNLQTTTRNGITITNNNDGTFTLNGTATANSDFRIDQDTYNGTQHLFNLSSGTYTLGANLISGLEFRVMQDSTWQSKSVTASNNTNTFTLNSNWNNLFTYIYVFNGTTLDNFVLKPYLNSGTNTNFCPFGSYSSQIDETNKEIKELNDKLDGLSAVINSEEVPPIDIDIDLASDTPISDLLLMPLNIINKVQTANSGTCTSYVLPFDFFGGNNTLTLPCIDLEDYLGHDVYTVLDTILCFYFAYEIAMLCVSIYNNITSLNDGFDALYEPKHGAPDGASSYIGRHGGGKR